MRDRGFEPLLSAQPMDKGSGMGLAASRRIVTAHGGFLEVGSDPGAGVDPGSTYPRCQPTPGR